MRSSKYEDLEIPLASLIDIVFLLIIFFVVTSAIDKEALDESVRLAETYFVNPVRKRDPRTVTVNIKKINERETEVNIGQIPLSLKTLASVLAKTRASYGNDVPVVIRSDGQVQYREVDKVMKIIGEAGLYRIKLSARDQGRH
jgi:biopolymer transport protein ExbD